MAPSGHASPSPAHLEGHKESIQGIMTLKAPTAPDTAGWPQRAQRAQPGGGAAPFSAPKAHLPDRPSAPSQHCHGQDLRLSLMSGSILLSRCDLSPLPSISVLLRRRGTTATAPWRSPGTSAKSNTAPRPTMPFNSLVSIKIRVQKKAPTHKPSVKNTSSWHQ